MKHMFVQKKSFIGEYHSPNGETYKTVLASWWCKHCGAKVLAIPEGETPTTTQECK